jgi:hypothetical protein
VDTRISKLTSESIYLTSWSKIRLKLAKVIFSRESVAEILTHISFSNHLIFPKEIFDGPEEFDRNLQQKSGTVHPNILLFRTKKIANLLPQPMENNELETALFLSHLYAIFPEMLLSKVKYMNKNNLACIKTFFKDHLQWFAE